MGKIRSHCLRTLILRYTINIWHSVSALLVAGVINIGFGYGLSTVSQQEIEETPVLQTQGQTSRDLKHAGTQISGSGDVNEITGTPYSSASTSEVAPFSNDTCRPEQIEVTPCQ